MNPALIILLAWLAKRNLDRAGITEKVEAILNEKFETAEPKILKFAERTRAYVKKKVGQFKGNRWVPPADDPAVKGTMLWEASRRCRLCRKHMCAEALQCPWCGIKIDPRYVKQYMVQLRTALGTPFRNGQIQCPRCRQWDIRYGTLEGGGIGLWCPYCNKSLQELREW